MICPKCRCDTRVVSSRPHPDDATVIVRRRHCVACPHRFETQEGTIDIARQRKRNTARCDARRDRRLARMTPDELAAYRRSESIRTQTHQEAKATGRPLAEVRRGWSVPSTPAPPRRSHPLP